jgi:DNA modification methylase
MNYDLNFHTKESGYASHNYHSFPAKFPPQLPRLFIKEFTQTGDIILDPMQGSGTTILESSLLNRLALGLDIDPLSILISKVKITSLDYHKLKKLGKNIIQEARISASERPPHLINSLENRWDDETRDFINYWFDTDTQFELMALILAIENIVDLEVKQFFELAFSAIIITKSGGVSLALDLAHTRPHRAKLIYSKTGEIIEGDQFLKDPPKNIKFNTKKLKSPIDEFAKRINSNLNSSLEFGNRNSNAILAFGNSQNIPLSDSSIDLIVTSPPYASNAIDYMRAHKFSLVWFGYRIKDLTYKRREYIGAELLNEFSFEDLPDFSANKVAEISELDQKKGRILHRYYSEMKRVIKEMYRTLKPGKVAIFVVGNSDMRGRDTETQNCLADIGHSIGFDRPLIGVRYLDRNRRMLPVGKKIDPNSQIQKRMHNEYVIGFHKPIKEIK